MLRRVAEVHVVLAQVHPHSWKSVCLYFRARVSAEQLPQQPAAMLVPNDRMGPASCGAVTHAVALTTVATQLQMEFELAAGSKAQTQVMLGGNQVREAAQRLLTLMGHISNRVQRALLGCFLLMLGMENRCTSALWSKIFIMASS